MTPEAEAEGSALTPNSEELKLTTKQDWQDWQDWQKMTSDHMMKEEGGGNQ